MASIRPMMLEDLLHFNVAWLQKRLHEPRPKFTSSVRVTLMGITIMFASLLHLKISCHLQCLCRNLRRWIWMSSQRPSIWTSTSIISLDGRSAVQQLDCFQCETSVPLFVCVLANTQSASFAMLVKLLGGRSRWPHSRLYYWKSRGIWAEAAWSDPIDERDRTPPVLLPGKGNVPG